MKGQTQWGRAALFVGVATATAAAQQSSEAHAPRIIDAHLHVYDADPRWTSRAPNPATGQMLTATSEAMHRTATLEEMRRYNIVLGVISNDGRSGDMTLAQRWMAAAPGKFMPAIGFNGPDEVSPQWIREQARAGSIKVIGEIGAPYAGYSAGDAVYEPFFALAEELDIPIAVHVGTAAGQATYNGSPKYRMELNRPLHLEDMLARHPRARVQIMHAGWPFGDETVALLKANPQTYVDLGVIAWTQPRAEFQNYLRRLVDAGLGKRIMFGSDQMVWPEAIGMSVDAVESATFLSEEQKQDIFCRNAARFFRLNPNPC